MTADWRVPTTTSSSSGANPFGGFAMASLTTFENLLPSASLYLGWVWSCRERDQQPSSSQAQIHLSERRFPSSSSSFLFYYYYYFYF